MQGIQELLGIGQARLGQDHQTSVGRHLDDRAVVVAEEQHLIVVLAEDAADPIEVGIEAFGGAVLQFGSFDPSFWGIALRVVSGLPGFAVSAFFTF